MLSQSRQHNYVHRHNIRPCPFFFVFFLFLFMPLICDFSSFHSFFHFFYLFFCVSRRFTATFFFRLRFLLMQLRMHAPLIPAISDHWLKEISRKNGLILIRKQIQSPFVNHITIGIESTSQRNANN